jgi:hypothetical protein
MTTQTTAPAEHLSICLSLLKHSSRRVLVIMYKLQSPASQKLRDHEVTYEERRILESEKFDSEP